MRTHQGLPEIYDKIEKRYGANDLALWIRGPIALLLMGDPDRSRQALAAELAKLASKTHLAADYYRSFAAAFREKLA